MHELTPNINLKYFSEKHFEIDGEKPLNMHAVYIDTTKHPLLNGEVDDEVYNEAVFSILINLKHEKIIDFINYNLSIHMDQVQWCKDLLALMDDNDEPFYLDEDNLGLYGSLQYYLEGVIEWVGTNNKRINSIVLKEVDDKPTLMVEF